MPRAIWTAPDTQTPQAGQTGVAYPDPRHDDPTSVAYLAWLFQPDADANAYSCARHEFYLLD